MRTRRPCHCWHERDLRPETVTGAGGRRRVVVVCESCGRRSRTVPLARRPRMTLLELLLQLDAGGVRYGYEGGQLKFGEEISDRLLAESWHHTDEMRRRLTPASAPWPEEGRL